MPQLKATKTKSHLRPPWLFNYQSSHDLIFWISQQESWPDQSQNTADMIMQRKQRQATSQASSPEEDVTGNRERQKSQRLTDW